MENKYGQIWTREQTNLLIENFNAGKSIREITSIINEHIKDSRPGTIKTIRTFDSVAHKLKNLGLISEAKLSDTLKAKQVSKSFNRLCNYDGIKKEVFDRDKNSCVACGVKKDLQLAHIVPFRETSQKISSELVTLCKKCHELFDNFNEFETRKVFDYMCGQYSGYEKKYKMTYRYNPVTNRDMGEIKKMDNV
ncbi:MAG: HNH endonuclease [Candidatus Pacearchaeota archaeon]